LLKLSFEKDPILTLFSQLPTHTIQNQDKKKKGYTWNWKSSTKWKVKLKGFDVLRIQET
jgi:hypothetical protein